MSKIDKQFELRSWPSGLPLHNQQVEVLVPYDAKSGTVYLNACGADVDEVAVALTAIDIVGLARVDIRTVVATLDFSDEAALQSNLFPVWVPVHVETGKVHLGGVGSNATEAEANLSFWDIHEDDYRFVTAMMRMPAPTLEFDADENFLPRPSGM
jgi:hypothetical protein